MMNSFSFRRYILFPRKIAISFKYKEGSVLPIIDCNFFIFKRFCNLYLIDCLFFIINRLRNLSYIKKVQSLGERSRNLWRGILWKNETFFSIERYCNLSCLKNGLLYSKDCDFFHIKIAGFYNFERLPNSFWRKNRQSFKIIEPAIFIWKKSQSLL